MRHLHIAMPLMACAIVLAGETPLDFSIDCSEQVDVLAHYPLDVGNRWTHRHVYKTHIGGGEQTVTCTWTSETTVTHHVDVPEGKIILRSVVNHDLRHDRPGDAADWIEGTVKEKDTAHLLVKGNYVYPWGGRAWDDKSNAFANGFREALKKGKVTPCLFFPMQRVLRWSSREVEERDRRQANLWRQGKGPAPNPGMYYWCVDGRQDVNTPYGAIRDAWLLVSRTNGGPTRVWFKEGIGVVKGTFTHSGTFLETECVLTGFTRARRE